MNAEDLYERLDAAFAITPAPAPVDEAIQRGRRLRWRRRAVGAAGLVAIAALGTLVPLAAHLGAAPSPASPERYTVTVQPPGPHSPVGEIAQGTVNGMTWRVAVTMTPDGSEARPPCVWVTGSVAGSDCVSDAVYPFSYVSGAASSPAELYGLPVTLHNGFGSVASDQSGDPDLLWGAVAPDVSQVTATLTNGTVLRLRPVLALGTRYVAFAFPPGTIRYVVAYSRYGEISRATPFEYNGGYTFVRWLRPGEPGLPRRTYLLGSGTVAGYHWTGYAYEGPWGVCVVGAEGNADTSSCWPDPGTDIHSTGEAFVNGSGIAAGDATPDVTRIVFTLPGGTTMQVRPFDVGGGKFWIVAVPFPNNIPWKAYDASGHVIATGSV